MEKLLEVVLTLPNGPIGQASKIESLISESWDEFSFSDDGGMTADKFLGRTKKLYWNPPILSFEIERHGGTVQGSTRAEIQKWALDLENRTGELIATSHKQIKPRQKNLNVKSIAAEIEFLILNKALDGRLSWGKDGSVRVHIGKIIPKNSGVQQTVSNHRKRFRDALDELLRSKGWEKLGPSHYKPQKI